MKKISTITIILLSIFCIGCKKIHCPAFPADLNYFPYSKGQELKFINSHNSVSNFVISNRENSKAYSLEWNCKCVCEASSGFNTNQTQDSLTLSCNLYFGGGRYDATTYSIFLTCNFQYSFHFSDELSKRVLLEQETPYNELSKHLSDTISIENEDNKIVNKVVIVKGKGLVSYTTADGEEWKLVK
ncbi:MAG: hypothetical protein LBU83_11005 [Bacteroidales bacterium]|jgi:hypothetical protein|nr:hypothetical protein [Bacteroidales bacterium]